MTVASQVSLSGFKIF